ncbi:MAG TPA: urate hydroxylase PuuD [Gaiellaceae bacterium]|nr:urate hydroxylase PuuD [Gaiellaceae bacterium]
MDPYLRDVLDACLRLLHVVAGIAWIGASFYFIRLDLGLRPTPGRSDDSVGEYWGVHGGGFYHSRRYALPPDPVPEPLHWFKWEAYTTWLSGFSLLVVLYYTDARARLVDPGIADLEPWQAVTLSVGGLALGWLVYDVLCRVVRDERALAVCVAALVVGTAFAAGQLFAARAAYLQVGAMLGTIMAANVFRVIIPAHWELVRAREARRPPDPAPGLEAKRRSVHNNYLTLPVVFAMLAGHFPVAYGHSRAWLVLLAVMALLAFVRHFFNLWHRGRRAWWILGVAAAAVVALALVLRPEDEATGAAVPTDVEVGAIVQLRCARCHSGVAAPKGIRLGSAADVRARAELVATMVRSRAMPPGNATGMTDAERRALLAWLGSG